MIRKILFVLMLILTFVCIFTSCEGNTCSHDYVETVIKEAECLVRGKVKHHCSLCGDTYYSDILPLLHPDIEEATCTTPAKCKLCGMIEGNRLAHNYSEIDGTCTSCGDGVKFILPNTPITIKYKNTKECIIQSIKVERDGSQYFLIFTIQSTYHKNGNNYSDDAAYGWKLYDEDGFVVDSGTGYSDGAVAVGEKTKDRLMIFSVKNGKTYRLELLDIG